MATNTGSVRAQKAQTRLSSITQLAIKILLLFVDGLFNGFLVEKYTACEIHRKSDFGWHWFQNVAYSTSPCLMRKGVEKSQAILALRDGFQDYFSKLLQLVPVRVLTLSCCIIGVILIFQSLCQ